MEIVNLVLGLVILFLGRKLFWLFVGITGFVVGFNLATQYLASQQQWVIWLIAILVGLVGAALAVAFQRVAAGFAGLLAGGYLLVNLMQMLNAGGQTGEFSWLLFIVGGIVGAILAMVLLDWALIVLSSLLGANLIVQSVTLDPGITTLAFVVLFVVGVIVQASMLRRDAAAV